MRANNPQTNFNDDRKRDHLRQQERLKAMATTSDEGHTMSADLMIDNLLKSTFTKLPQTPLISHKDNSDSELPLWLQCENSRVPAQYKYLWSVVESSVNMADTQKVSQLLLTSGLTVDVLGFIWNLANKTIPGQLTKQEFYIVLALVSLTQTGYKFSDLNILKSIPAPLLPVLHLDIQHSSIPKLCSQQNQQLYKQNEFLSSPALEPKIFTNLNKNVITEGHFINSALNDTVLIDNFKQSLNNQKEKDRSNLLQGTGSNSSIELGLFKETTGFCSTGPTSSSSSSSELDHDFSAFQSGYTTTDTNFKITNISPNDSGDDFTEFQSANAESLDPLETVVLNQKREVPKISLPKTLTGKFSSMKSNVLKISLETEKKLKVLPPTECLSTLPESKISSSNKVSTSISVLGSNHGIGSRLANHSLSSKLDKPKFHKHHKIKINPVPLPNQSANEEIIFGVKPRNLEAVIPKCRPKYLNTCKSFALKETTIRNDDDISESSCWKHNINEPNSSTSHSGESTRQIEIPMVGTFNETILPTQSKSQTVDLIVVHEDKYSALREIELELNKDVISDSKKVSDDFGEFLSADIPDTMFSTNEEKENWGDWNVNTKTNSCLSNSFGFDALKTNSIMSLTETENNLLDTFDLLTVKENDNQISEPNPDSLEEQNCFGFSIRESNLDDLIKQSENKDIDLIKQSEKKDNDLKLNQALNLQSDNDFWEFFSNDGKSLNEENFTRHDSLPSLDLKISSTDESEQETVWRKCLDSCHNLIQDGFKIFNNISTKSVLDEIFAEPKTEDYLNNLNIAFQISKRISQNFSNLPAVQEELEKFWGRLQDLCFEYNIKLNQEESICLEAKIKCNICLKHIGYNIITQGNSSYHPSCANLWINCVETALPFSI